MVARQGGMTDRHSALTVFLSRILFRKPLRTFGFAELRFGMRLNPFRPYPEVVLL